MLEDFNTFYISCRLRINAFIFLAEKGKAKTKEKEQEESDQSRPRSERSVDEIIASLRAQSGASKVYVIYHTPSCTLIISLKVL